MPVIIIGADTPLGEAIVEEVQQGAAELRVFISGQEGAAKFRRFSAKVALGDVSDFSHVEAASLNCFCAILIMEAASDRRERSFATQPEQVWSGWAKAVQSAGVKRVIWVGEKSALDNLHPLGGTLETARVETDSAQTDSANHLQKPWGQIAKEAADLEGRDRLPD